MKNFKCLILFIIVGIFTLTSCSNKREELYKITDDFVKELETKYSFGVFESIDYKKISKDGVYQVMPSGRLIIIKYFNYAEEGEYIKLRDDLAAHYSDDQRVRDVYINRGGTVAIDCRE